MGVKRIILVAAAIVLLLTGIIIVGTRLSGYAKRAQGALNALPPDATLVVRIPTAGGVAAQWIQSDAASGLLQSVPFFPVIDSFISSRQRPEQNPRRVKTDCYISIYTPQGMPAQWICALEVDGTVKSADALREYVFGPNTETYRERMYEGVLIRTTRVKVNEELREWFYCVTEGIGIVATSSESIESSIRTLISGQTLMRKKQFSDLFAKRSSNEGITFFLQPNRFFESFGQTLKEPWRTAARALRGWTSWVALDAKLQGQMVVASGATALGDSEKGGVRLMQQADRMRLIASKALPAECDFFLRWADGRAGENLSTLPAAEQNEVPKYTAADRLRDCKLLQGAGNGEIVLAHLPFPELREAERWVVSVSSQEPSLAAQLFSDSLCKGNNPESRTLAPSATVKIYSTHRPDFFRSLLSPLFNDSVAAYFIQADGALLFSSSKKTLERVFLAKSRQQTLDQSETFGLIREKLNEKSNFTLYVSPSLGSNPAKIFAQKPTDTKLWGWIGQLRGGVFQLTADKNIAYYRLVALQGNPTQREEARQRPEWETRLDAPLLGRPLVIDTHLPKNGKLILVQDTANVLYRLSEKGTIEWRRPLEEAILGEPKQVDVYANGKIQYAFATRSKIWVIDRNGNDVEGFPVRLQQAATAPLGVFDYENSKNYRFMVCLADRTALMYDKRGKRVADFAPTMFDHPIVQQPKHTLYEGKDYIIVSDPNRIYLLNRRGEERLRTAKPVAPLAGSSVEIWKARGELAAVDAAGALCKVSLQTGDVQRVELQGKGDARGALLIESALQGEVCAIIARGKVLAFYSCDGKLLASHQFENELDSRMHLFSFAQHDWRVGVREANGDSLWLLDMQGNVVDGFPLGGNTGFSIGRLNRGVSRFSLIVGQAPSLVVNYSLPQ